MYLCDGCRKKKILKTVRGDGKCEKHGRFAFYTNRLKEFCPACAREKDICQLCGRKLTDDETAKRR